MVASVQNNKSSMRNKINHLLDDYNRTSCYLLEFIPQEIAETSIGRVLGDLSINNSLVTPQLSREFQELPTNQADFEVSLMDAEDEECSSLLYSDDEIIILETEEYEIPCSDDEDVIEVLEESKCDLDDTTTEGKEKMYAELATNEMEYFRDSPSGKDSATDDSLLNVSNCEPHIDNSSMCLPTSETVLCLRVPEWFLRKYRQGKISPNLINVINFQRWFIPSQSEDYFGKPSHEICLPILQTVVGILLRGMTEITNIKCHARGKGMYLAVYDITPLFEVRAQPLPSLLGVASIPTEIRASILVDCLDLPKNINLRVFPREWRLYVLILMYWKNHCKQPAANENHIRAVMLCLIYLNVIDSKIGFVRLASDLKRIKKEKRRTDKRMSKISDASKVVSADFANSLDVTEDQLSVDTNLPTNSLEVEDSLSIDNDLTVSFSNMVVDHPTVPTDLITGPLEVIEDPLPVDINQKSMCENLPNEDALPATADDSAVHGKSNLTLPEGDTENKLFTNEGECDSVQEILDFVSEEDCFKSAKALLNYHQVNPALLKNRKDFDIKLIHSLAQLQHCIQSICILNSVLDFPFVQCQPHLCFSGTFLYNFYSELYHRKLADGYITRTVLTKASSIIALYRYLISSWEAVTSKKVVRPKLNVKKKKKKKSDRLLAENILNKFAGEQELYHDPDNIYSMLPEE